MSSLLIDPSLLDDKVEELPIDFDSPEEEAMFREQLIEWTEEHGSVYVTEVNDVIFCFRTIKRSEWNTARNIYEDVFDRAEYIVKQCVLEPLIEDYSNDIYAGIPETLCVQILNESGYSDSQKLKIQIARWERDMELIDNQIPLVIKEAFQDISLEEIESWPNERISEYYVKAKWLLKTLRGIELTDSEE